MDGSRSKSARAGRALPSAERWQTISLSGTKASAEDVDLDHLLAMHLATDLSDSVQEWNFLEGSTGNSGNSEGQARSNLNAQTNSDVQDALQDSKLCFPFNFCHVKLVY